MQDLMTICLLSVLTMIVIGLAASIIRDMVQEHLARRAWEKKIKANRDEIIHGMNRRA